MDTSTNDKVAAMNILDHKYTNFRVWLDNIRAKRGLESTLSIKQIYDMLAFLNGVEQKIDSIIIDSFDEYLKGKERK